MILDTVSRWALFLSVSLHIGLLLVKFSAPQPQQSAAPPTIQLQLNPKPAQLDQPTSVIVANRVVAKSVKIQGSAIANTRGSWATPTQRASAVSEVRSSVVAEVKQPLDLSTAQAIAILPERQTLVQRKSHPNLATETKEVETVLTQQLNKAVQPDCRKAHAGAGLLAIPMLVKDAITDSGCQW